MQNFIDTIIDYWENTVIKKIVIAIGICIFFTCYYAISLYYDNLNKEGLEIVNSQSFVGEVMSKKTHNTSWTSYRIRIYRMRIIGEYLSDNNEVLFFDKNLSVNLEMYKTYEVGDIISHN